MAIQSHTFRIIPAEGQSRNSRFPLGDADPPPPPPPPPQWNLPATIMVAQGSNRGVRQWLDHGDGATINVTGLPSGVTYNAAQERLEVAEEATVGGSSTVTFTANETISDTATVEVVEAADWQLEHFAESEFPLDIYYPRPDTETNTWARHRKSHPGVPYRVPVIGAMGAPPWRFELLEGPPGMTVGEFLPWDGVRFDWENPGDYGIVSWPDPTADGMPVEGWLVKVRLTDQELTQKEIEWRLVVTTEGFVFVDPVNGDNSNDGSINAPLENTRGWFLEDDFDNTYSGYQVIYRGGTHHIYFNPDRGDGKDGIPGGRGAFGEKLKPLVHYGYPGETVIWDCSVSQWNFGQVGNGRGGMDRFFGDLILEDLETTDNKIYFFDFGNSSSQWADMEGEPGPDDGGCRITHFNLTVRDWVGAWDASSGIGNSGFTWGNNTNGGRKFYCYSRITVDSVHNSIGMTNHVFFQQGAVSRLALEFIDYRDVTGMNFFHPKGQGSWISGTYIKTQQHGLAESGSSSYYRPGGAGYTHWRYCKLKSPSNQSTAASQYAVNSGNATYPIEEFIQGSKHLSRSTLVAGRSLRSNLNAAGGWPHTVKNLVAVSSFTSGRGVYYTGDPNDPNPDKWRHYTLPNSPLDENMNLLPQYRDELLGKFGAEVA